ncbi:sigma 54 modulation/S30EA ribosomal C-terminal domain-containing protein [Dactylosporangium sp. AC04546]|uniref:sigma 54 modulation/S30EA ribosomal C-terminal domain-containing protein n=1 Tax=Dactylosporangium sp. AC04546 TaxID=2862460 RepID=UPI001EDDDD9C|nr:sigma 54 modulation/S30EA ribosomal C-terminal domain-containing protein [Dactylosporangium sp. AC04546]WVK89285.1 sigma 54 modulation/S30EA ribosomal C-terminal domain-containing protein [Dactylosporangium sp. AC04546]
MGVDVIGLGVVTDGEVGAARGMVSAVLAHHGVADGARVRLTGAACGSGPVVAQVNLRVSGAPARVQVTGRDALDAAVAVAVRLERQVRRLTTRWEAWPWPDPERRALAVPGPGDVTRVKHLELKAGPPCRAAAFMAAMDYDFCLFTDAGSGEDAVVYRSGPTGLRLARQYRMHPDTSPGHLGLSVNARRTPVLDRAEAAEHLCAGWLPFLFFTDRVSGRGNLLYRRYDGTLGLMRPAGRR